MGSGYMHLEKMYKVYTALKHGVYSSC